MKKLLSFVLFVLTVFSGLTSSAIAISSETTNGLNYLKTKQENSGKISGFGGESQWASIAFSANDINVSDVKNPDVSLKTYLLSDHPASDSAATEWEKRILAIVAIGDNPGDFGGVNYVQNLEALAKENQLGETNLLNDDIFGLLALMASGSLADQTIKQNSLDFIIDHQASDGGFSWTTDSTCAWCGSDNNDTAAALQALSVAKEQGLTNENLDISIDKAKTYLLSTQKSDGGFAYDSFSDADGSSTAWSLMALNSLGLGDSNQAQLAKSWLINNQENDGGFHWMAGYGSDTSTTSHVLIALSGRSWILKIYSPDALPPATPTATPSPSPTPTPTPIPTPTATPSPSPTPTPTPILSPTPQPTATPVILISSPTSLAVRSVSETPLTSKPEVLGITDASDSSENVVRSENVIDEISQNATVNREIFLGLISLGGVISLIIGLKIWEKRKAK